MSTPYVSDKVKALLNTAVWYVRLKNLPQAQKVFNQAVTLVENEGGLRDPDLHNVFEQYASSFRRLSRMSEADKLSALAQHLRAAFPGLFNPDGSEIPWWKRPEFLRSLPALPVQFKASRAAYSSVKPFSLGCLGTLFVGGLLIGTVLRPAVDWLGEGAAGLIYILACPLSGVLAEWWYVRSLRRKRDESWCKLTAEGIEYHEPNKHCKFRWSEIDNVWTDWVSGSSEDETFDAVVVAAGKRKFQMSARFFTEQEVKWVDSMGKLKSGAQ